MNLSEHFTLEEMTHSEIGARKVYDNTPNEKEVANLRRLCGLLEKVKEVIGNKSVFINSGFRSKQVNDAVGSKDSNYWQKWMKNALTTYRTQVLEEVIADVQVNQKGTFTDDGGYDCWYTEELVKAIEELKHPTN